MGERLRKMCRMTSLELRSKRGKMTEHLSRMKTEGQGRRDVEKVRGQDTIHVKHVENC